MLNKISSYELTLVETHKPLPRFGLGACLPTLPAAAKPVSKGAVASRRPSARTASGAELGQHFALTASGQPVGAAAGSSAASDQQSAYNMTLTIAFGAGDLGPHPVREPV